MSRSELLKILEGLRPRLLNGIAPQDAIAILAAAEPRRYRSNSVVVKQGERAERLFLLISGRTRFFFETEDGKKIALLWLTPGEIFGGTALLSTPETYLVSTETLQVSSLLSWDRATARQLSVHHPKLVENLLRTASDYLAWYVATHEALVSHSARERLARVLICLSESIGQKVPGGFEFEATNEDLANAANVTPFTASRQLRSWHRKGQVVKTRGKVLLRWPERLLGEAG